MKAPDSGCRIASSAHFLCSAFAARYVYFTSQRSQVSRPGRPPYKSNFYCHPGRAGGTPMLLGALLMAQKRPREAIVPLEDAACRSANPELETYLAIALRVGDGMGLDVDPRSERCVLRFDRRPRRATHVGGHELHIHARCVDDDKAADKRDDDETPRP